jgi:hypothetical protein
LLLGAANSIDGLMSLSSHIKIIARKTKNQLHNTDHKVAEGIYVAGTLAGWRRHAAGSGAAVRYPSLE